MRQGFASKQLIRTTAAFCFCAFLSPAQVSPEEYYQNLLRKHAGHYSECLQPEMRGSAHAVNVAIVLDASGPTKVQMAGGATIDVLRNVARRFARSLPSNVNVALVVYGHRGNMTFMGKDDSCKAADVLVPASPNRTSVIANPVLEALKPGGWTPLQLAIRKSADSFAGVIDLFTDNRIYLFAAGMDTCGGLPREAARLVHAERTRTTINVLSPTSSAAEQEELRAVAKAGGGEFVAAPSLADMNRYLDGQVKLIRETYKSNRLSPACFETRLTAERSAMQHDLMLDSTGPKATIGADVVTFVNDRLQQRQEKIRALIGRRDLTPETLDKELRAIE